MFMMDLEDKPHPSVAGVDKDISCSVKQTVNNSGTFSIESILKSGGFRCVPPTPPDFQNLTGLRHPHHHQLHGGFSDIGVKKEDLDSDLRDQRPSLLSPGSSLGAVDNATCQEDSGTGQPIYLQKYFLNQKYLQRMTRAGVTTGRRGLARPSQRLRSRLWSPSLRKTNICPSPRGCNYQNS